jgi:hypothetical protein
MIDQETIAKVRSHYSDLHPLIVQRSAERSHNVGDFFDIISHLHDKIKKGAVYPLVWDDEKHCWVKTKDLFQSKVFFKKKDSQQEDQQK